jgi:hypothetical protein
VGGTIGQYISGPIEVRRKSSARPAEVSNMKILPLEIRGQASGILDETSPEYYVIRASGYIPASGESSSRPKGHSFGANGKTAFLHSSKHKKYPGLELSRSDGVYIGRSRRKPKSSGADHS